MRVNNVQELWKTDQTVFGGWLTIPSAFSAEIMAHQNWDVLTVDMQHGLVDASALVPMLTAISTTDVIPFVRVPWLEAGIIMKVLDAGSYGVICPMINTLVKMQSASFHIADMLLKEPVVSVRVVPYSMPERIMPNMRTPQC